MILAPIPVTASAMTLRKDSHAGATLVAKRAAGIAFTLPAATGTGMKMRIFVSTTITSNNLVVSVASASDVMQGYALLGQDAADTTVLFEAAADSDTITMNGSTKGGIRGDIIELEDVETGVWAVRVTGSATGTEATPFSAAV
jgi:hypothetical protein